MKHIKGEVRSRLDAWPAAALSGALLLAAAFLVVVALMPDHALVKAGVLAWVVLP